jgi:Ca2+/Na+ antiporter
MNAVLLLGVDAASLQRTVLVILIASIVLLSVRVWNANSNFTLTRQISWLLDGTILVLVVLFFVFVIVRFKTLA